MKSPDREQAYKERNLNTIDVLKYNNEQRIMLEEEMQRQPISIRPINDKGEWEDVHSWKLRIVFIKEGGNNPAYFHMHPELVHKKENNKETWTYLCP